MFARLAPLGGSSATRTPVDVLVVAPNTTPGLKRDHEELLGALTASEVSYSTATSDYGLLRHLPRGRPLDEMVVTSALRYATLRKLASVKPRALLLATSQTGLLLPRGLLARSAIRFDGLAASSRPGRRDTVTRALERRCLREAIALFPWSVEAAHEAATIAPAKPLIVWPSPVRAGTQPAAVRRPGAVCYANDPHKKGLDIAVAAWTEAAPAHLPLFVTGLEEATAKRFLFERGIDVPPNVSFCGRLAEADYRRLSASVEIHLGTSRIDQYATTQLEALLDGALLVTVPSAGPISSLRFARELDARLVAPTLSAEGVVLAVRNALALGDAERRRYRERAAVLMRQFTREAFVEQLRAQIVPLLLAG